MPNFDSSSHLIEAKLLPLPVKKADKKPFPPKKTHKLVKYQHAPNDFSRESIKPDAGEPTEASQVAEPLWREEDRPAYEEMQRLPPPSFVDIDFDVKRVNSFGSGRAHYRYQAEPQERYSLRSEMEAVGLASIAFAGKRLETSMGKITVQGLQPDLYRVEVTGKPDKLQVANFDWGNNKLTLKTAKTETVEELPEGTQYCQWGDGFCEELDRRPNSYQCLGQLFLCLLYPEGQISCWRRGHQIPKRSRCS